LSSTGKVSPPLPVLPYQPPVAYPQRVAWAKLSKFEPRFARFVDILRRIYVVPFMEALKKALVCLKFLKELLSKKGDIGDASVAPIREACSAIL